MAKKKMIRSDQTTSSWERSKWVEWYWLPRTVGPTKHHNLDYCVVEIRWLCFSWSKSTQWNEGQEHWQEDYEPSFGPSPLSVIAIAAIVFAIIYFTL